MLDAARSFDSRQLSTRHRGGAIAKLRVIENPPRRHSGKLDRCKG